MEKVQNKGFSFVEFPSFGFGMLKFPDGLTGMDNAFCSYSYNFPV